MAISFEERRAHVLPPQEETFEGNTTNTRTQSILVLCNTLLLTNITTLYGHSSERRMPHFAQESSLF